MKKCIIIFFFVVGFIYAQDVNKLKIFSRYEVGLYGGTNFKNISGIGSILFFEGLTNITSKINLKFSFGYKNVFDLTEYNVNTYEYIRINNKESYNAISYKVDKTKYKIIPFSLGLQYYFNLEYYNPYLLTEVNYNWIDSETIKSTYQLYRRYNYYADMPREYKTKNILPVSSYSYSIGAGIKYQITTTLGLDFRYMFLFDNEIINIHQFIVGLFFY